jgi:gelsolin
VHLWQGKTASADDAALAQARASEIEEALGASAVQHRHREGFESPYFVNLFRAYGGLKYLESGYDLNIKKGVRPQRPKRLLHVTGKHTVRVTPVEPTAASLSHDGVFVLDCGMRIYQWNGRSATRGERAKVCVSALP